MAAPAFVAAGAQATSFSASLAVPVPAGAASGHVAVVGLTSDSDGATYTVTPPAGFTEAADSPILWTTLDWLRVYWKRLTAGDTGNYTFTLSAGQFWAGKALLYSGCVASGDPFDVTNSASKATTSPSAAVSDTTTVADTMLVWMTGTQNSVTMTPPTGFTLRTSGAQNLHQADLAQAAAGATGSLTGSWSGSAHSTSWLGALKSTGGGAPPDTTKFFALLS